MEKIDLPVGKKVKGYGLRNEFGEFFFIPAQEGIRTDGMKIVKQGDRFTIYECKKKVKVVFDVPKAEERLKFLNNYLNLVNAVLSELRQYDF